MRPLKSLSTRVVCSLLQLLEGAVYTACSNKDAASERNLKSMDIFKGWPLFSIHKCIISVQVMEREKFFLTFRKIRFGVFDGTPMTLTMIFLVLFSSYRYMLAYC